MNKIKKVKVVQLKGVLQRGDCPEATFGKCNGKTVLLGKGYENGMVGLYIPVGTVLSKDFVENNECYNVRKLIDWNFRVIPFKIFGKKIKGLFLPLSCLYYTNGDLGTIKLGDSFTSFCGNKISVESSISTVLDYIFGEKK